MHDPPFLCACLTQRSAPVVVPVGAMAAETLLVSAQSHHSIHELNRADHTGKVAALFRLARRALQASEALEKQITLVDVFVVKGVQPLLMGFLHDSAGLSAGDPPCFGSKGS